MREKKEPVEASSVFYGLKITISFPMKPLDQFLAQYRQGA